MNKLLRKIVLFCIALSVAVSCTEVDDSLGLDFIPESQKMNFGIDTVSGITAFLTKTDSLPSMNVGTIVMGSTYSSTYGYSNASTFIQFMPWYFYSSDVEETSFGTNPTADSLKIIFLANSFQGTPVAGGQVFEVYKAKEFISLDTIVYSNYDPSSLIESEPMFDFTFTDTSYYETKLNPLNQEAWDFMQDLMDTDQTVCDNAEEFLELFNGLYFKPKVENADHQMFAMTVSNTSLLLYGVSHDEDDETVVTDTLRVIYYFEDDSDYYGQSIIMADHDYTGSLVEPLIDDTTALTAIPLEDSYIQTLAGVTTMLRFPQDFIDTINALKLKDGEQYNNLVINEAKLYVSLDDKSQDSMDEAITRLGLFLDFPSATNIPDYLYEYEQAGYTIPFGGYLDRNSGYYIMDITTYLQYLIVDESTQRDIYLTPGISQVYNLGDIKINTPTDFYDPNKMTVRLKYTLTK